MALPRRTKRIIDELHAWMYEKHSHMADRYYKGI